MNSFKQALIQLKSAPKSSLFLGVSGTLMIYIVRHIPYLSAFLMAFGVLIIQEVACRLVVKREWPKNLHFLKNDLTAYVGTSLVLLPTVVLAGSAMGILQGPQELILTLPVALGMFVLSIYFYFILSHALRLHVDKKISLIKAIDFVGLSSLRNFKMYFVLSFYFGLFMILSGMSWGVGFVISLPWLLFANHFAYLELSRSQDLIARVPR